MEQIVICIQEDQGGGQVIGCCQRACACCGSGGSREAGGPKNRPINAR